MSNPLYTKVGKSFTPTSSGYREAAHVMFFAKTDEKLWNKLPFRALVNMHLRFDGRLGFPGGLIDPGENVEEALNREVSEEMGEGNKEVTAENWIETNFCSTDNILLHFYCMELTKQEFFDLEKRGLQAKEYGVEVLGHMRVPLYTRERNNGGFPMFLQNNFAGCARQNLLNGLLKHNIFSVQEIDEVQKINVN